MTCACYFQAAQATAFEAASRAMDKATQVCGADMPPNYETGMAVVQYSVYGFRSVGVKYSLAHLNTQLMQLFIRQARVAKQSVDKTQVCDTYSVDR